MNIDKSKAEDYIGMIVYQTFESKKLFIIESVSSVNDFDVTYVIKDINGDTKKISSLRLKSHSELVEDTEIKLQNHRARLWNFKKKLGLPTE